MLKELSTCRCLKKLLWQAGCFEVKMREKQQAREEPLDMELPPPVWKRPSLPRKERNIPIIKDRR